MNNKKLLYIIIALLLLGAIFWAVSFNSETPAPIEENSNTDNLEESLVMETVEGGDYLVLQNESSLLWEAGKTMVVNYKNQGSIDILNGEFSLEDGQISSGSLIFDMTSLQVITMTTTGANASLERHLKSDDFFSVEEFPQAELIIYPSNLVEDDELSMAYNLRGSLTIKGIDQDIEFPVLVYKINDDIIVEGTASLDRTLWDIRYGSDKFFDNLADNVIDDFFTVNFKIVAQKK
jgi:polyisoprenoid-binding protein YceI